MIDILATVPLDAVVQALLGYKIHELTLFAILKMGRLARLNRLISFLKADEDSKAAAKLGMICFLLIIYLHCFACLLWFFVQEG